MLQGTPQDQISSPPEGESPTSVPMQTVEADQLPREKGWTYDEFARIVGSLYLDSHHAMKVSEEQFQAVSDEYERRILQVQAEVQGKQGEVERLVKEVAQLRRELEIRNDERKPRPDTPSSPHRDDPLSDN